MTWSEDAWRAAVTVRTGCAEWLVANPPRIWLTTSLPRAVLQCLFLTLLGRVAAGEAGERFAFVGALAVVLSLSTLVDACDVPMLEKWSGTFHHLQRGVLRPGTTFYLRMVPRAVEGVVMVAACTVVVGVLTGRSDLSRALLTTAPLWLVMAVTSAAAGTAAAALAVGRRADVLVGNTFSYLVLAAGGMLIPAGRVGWLDAVGTVLPLRNGVLAVRASLDGAPYARFLLAELAVGAGWAVLGWAAYRIQSARAVRLGLDDYA